MRFYRYRRRAQIALTVVWVLVATLWIDIFLGQSHHHYGALGWMVLATVQVTTIWMDYWSVEEGSLVRHGLFYRRAYSGARLRYAGPVRRVKLRWVLRKSVQIDLVELRSPHFAVVADRSGFLNAIRTIAPDAEIVA